MKILILSHISDLVGGAEMSMINVFDFWTKKYDITPEFIMRKPAGTLADALNKRGWKYHTLDYTFWSDGVPLKTPEQIFQNALKNTRAIQEIERIIQRSKPDIVMTNSVVSPWAAIAAYYQQVTHLWFVREYGDLDHGRIFELGREKTFEDVDTMSELVVANSRTLAKHIEQYVHRDKVTALYTPFDLEDLNKRANEKVPTPFKYQDSLKAVITGNLAPSKGQLEAIKAVANLNKSGYNAELCVLGGKASKEFMVQVEDLIKKNNIEDKIHLVGFQKNPMAYVALADIGIMASRMEAFGRVTYEYIALGKPVVGSDSGATPEMVVDGENGYLYKPEDADSLTKGLMHYAENRELIEKHGDASLKLSKNMINNEYGADALFGRIASLLEKTTSPTYKKPLNYTHRLLEYIELADQYLKQTGKTSVKKLIKQRVRSRVGKKVRSIKQVGRRVLKK